MRRIRSMLGLGVAVAALAAAPAALAGPAPATLNVVHGIPGALVDVCLGPAGGTLAKAIPGFQFRQIVTTQVPAGTYDAAVVAAGSECTLANALPGLKLAGAAIPAGANLSVIASPTADGKALQLLVQANDTGPTRHGAARVTAYHAAAAPAVDVRAGRVLWLPKLFENVSNGQGGAREVAPGGYTLAIVPAGAGPFSAVRIQRVVLPANQNTVVYAVGSLADRTFALLTQRIPVG